MNCEVLRPVHCLEGWMAGWLAGWLDVDNIMSELEVIRAAVEQNAAVWGQANDCV